jgi:hypothetical protein
VFATILVAGGTASATTPVVTWNGSSFTQFDTGWFPASATNGVGFGDELEIHQGGANGDYPYDSELVWSNAGVFAGALGGGQGAPCYGTGCSGGESQDSALDLALAGDSSSSSTLFISMFGHNAAPVEDEPLPGIQYRTANWTGTGSVAWNNDLTDFVNAGQNTAGKTTSGAFEPTVAQANGLGSYATAFVEMHSGLTAGYPPFASSQLYYTVGYLNSNGHTVNWSSSPHTFPGTAGYHSSVAMWPMSATQYFVVEVHNASTGVSNLVYTTGYLTAGASTIAWDLPSAVYDSAGLRPQVAVCSEDNVDPEPNFGGTNTPAVIAFHSSGAGALWYHTGRIGGSSGHYVQWGGSVQVSGISALDGKPSVACTQNYGYEAHTNNSSGALVRRTFELN